jgi:hypothetical protein
MNSCLGAMPMLLLVCWSAAARAQPGGVGDKERKAAKQYAQEIMRAYVGGQHARFADLTHPKALELIGGRDKLISTLKAVQEKMRASGWAYGAATVVEPQQFAWMKDDLVTTLPFAVEYVARDRKKKDESYLIGVSPDRGKSWTFVDGRRITRDNVKDLFPKFPDGIKLPTDGKPK